MSPSDFFRVRSRSMNAIKVATLLTAFLAPHVARATTALTFFEHSSCNAGTSFQSYNDPNALQADTSCHQLPNGTVAVYVNQIDDGCTCKFCSVLFRPQSSSCLYIFAVFCCARQYVSASLPRPGTFYSFCCGVWCIIFGSVRTF